MSATFPVDRSDRELVQSMLAGQRWAWRAFTQRYDCVIHAAIDRVLTRFPRLVPALELEDVRAGFYFDLLAHDMHKLRVFDCERGVPLSSWLNLLAKRAARDHLRSALRRSSYVSTAALAIDVVDPEATSPLSRLLAKESLCHALSELERLSERDRQLLDLLLVQDQPPDAVAAAMNISVTTVYTKRHKLVHRLRSVLQTDRKRSASGKRLSRAAATRSRRAVPAEASAPRAAAY